MFSSIQSIPGLIFARFDVKAKIRPGVEASVHTAIRTLASNSRPSLLGLVQLANDLPLVPQFLSALSVVTQCTHR